MRLIMLTDMEGCAGILNSSDWCFPGGMYYEQGKSLLTQEVNAAVRGFLENGFDEILVIDGHGHGGLDLLHLDERVSYQRGFVGPYPVGLTDRYDALAFIGQHAKAGTPFAHLPHTSSMDVVDQRVNGISVGEFGQVVYMGAAMGIRPIFGSGDKAFCAEAQAMCPHIHTVCVKEGLMPGAGADCTAEAYRERNTAAIHIHPHIARRKIYEGACQAARAFLADREAFHIPPLQGPFTVELDFRTSRPGVHEKKVYTHENDLIEAWNLSWRDMPS